MHKLYTFFLVLIALSAFGLRAQAQRIGGVADPTFNPTDSGAPYYTGIFYPNSAVWPGQGGRLFITSDRYNYYNSIYYTLAQRYQKSYVLEVEPRSGARDTSTKPLTRGFVRGMINDPQGRPVQLGTSDIYGNYDTLTLSKSYLRATGTDAQLRKAWRGGRFAIPNAATGNFKAGLVRAPNASQYYFWITNNPTDTAGEATRTVIILLDTATYTEINRLVIDITLVEAADFLPTAQATYFFGRDPGAGTQAYTSFSLDAAMQVGATMSLPANTENVLLAKTVSSNAMMLVTKSASGATVTLVDNIGQPVAGFVPTSLSSAGKYTFSYDEGVLRAASYDTTDWTLRQYTLGASGGWATSLATPVNKALLAGKPLFYMTALKAWFCESGSIAFGTVNGYPDPIYRFLLHTDGRITHYGKPQGSTPYTFTAGANLSEGNGPLPRTQILYQSNEFMHNGVVSPNFSVLTLKGEQDPGFTSSLRFPQNMRWTLGTSHAFYYPDSTTAHFSWRNVELATGNRLLFPLYFEQSDLPPTSPLFPDTLYRFNFDGSLAPTARLVKGMGLFKLKAGGFATAAFLYPSGNHRGPQSYRYTPRPDYNLDKVIIQRLDASGEFIDTIAKINMGALPDSLVNLGRSHGLVAEDDAGGLWLGSVLNSSLGSDSAGQRSWLMRLAPGQPNRIIVLDSNYVCNWGIQKIEVLPGNRYRIFGRIQRVVQRPPYPKAVQVVLVDSVGRFLPDPEFASRTPYRFADVYGQRSTEDYSSISAMLPDGRVLLNNYRGGKNTTIMVQRDGRMDPSFLPLTSATGYNLKLLSTGKLMAYERYIFNDIVGLRPNMLGGISKNGLYSFLLNASPAGKGFIGGKVERVPSPVVASNGCSPTSRRMPVAGSMVRAGGRLAVTDTGGRYALALDTGRYAVSQELPNDFLMRQICPLARATRPVYISRQLQSILGQDFINETYDCARMSLSFGQSRGRLCSKGTIRVSYKNEGTATQPDARLRVFLPRELTVFTATRSFTREADSSYTFPLGDIAAGQSGFFTIRDSVACLAPDTNLRICWSARIEPMSVCGQIATAQINWDGAWLDAKASYVAQGPRAGQVRYRIVNRGAAMADSVAAVLSSQNFYPAFSGKIKLAASDSLELYVQSGLTFTSQLNLHQPADCPLGTGGTVGFSGQGPTPTYLALYDGWLGRQTVSACFPARFSYDPNEKLVYPEKLAEPGQMLDYIIHFENFGNDTAFSVIILDTLDAALDVSKLVVTGSSHPVNYTLSGTENQPIASFGFVPIQLTAKRQDSVASKGYVTFSVPLRPDIIRGTMVPNRANIYFDRNPAVVTAYATVQVRPYENLTGVAAQVVPLPTLQVAPNPAQGRFTVSLPKNSSRHGNVLEVRDLAGRLITTRQVWQEAPAQVEGLAPGVYMLKVAGLKAARVIVTE